MYDFRSWFLLHYTSLVHDADGLGLYVHEMPFLVRHDGVVGQNGGVQQYVYK